MCLVILVFNCSSEKKSYNKTRSENTVSAYEKFLKQYPESKYENKIRSLIDSTHFHQAKDKNTIINYINFLKIYPESQYKDSVDFLIEKIYFTQAKDKNSINAYIDFLTRYPNSNFTSEVKKIFEKKGTIIELNKNELVSIEKLSQGNSDRCWFEYRGLLKSESKDEQSKNRLIIWHKREGFDSEAIKLPLIDGKIGQVLGVGRGSANFFVRGRYWAIRYMMLMIGPNKQLLCQLNLF